MLTSERLGKYLLRQQNQAVIPTFEQAKALLDLAQVAEGMREKISGIDLPGITAEEMASSKQQNMEAAQMRARLTSAWFKSHRPVFSARNGKHGR